MKTIPSQFRCGDIRANIDDCFMDDDVMQFLKYIADTLTPELVSDKNKVATFLKTQLKPEPVDDYLFPQDTSEAPYTRWLMDDVIIADLKIQSVEYTRPNKGSGATSGVRLVFNIDTNIQCIDRLTLLEAFPGIRPSGMPRGRSLDEKTYLRY